MVDIRVEGLQLSRSNAEALRAGVGRARRGRGSAERRTAQPASTICREQGYFEAQVQVKRQEDEAEHASGAHCVLDPAAASATRCAPLNWRGTSALTTATLRERMGTQVAGMQRPHGRYSQAQVNDDLQAIETLYRANGYPSVKVTSEVIYDYEGDARRREAGGEGGRGAAGAGAAAGDPRSARR